MSEAQLWVVTRHVGDLGSPHTKSWVVEALTDGDDVFIAQCGAGDDSEQHALQIVSDHTACLGITDPETTVPELVAALTECVKTITHIASKPVESQCLLDWGNLDDACHDARAVLAKTGQKGLDDE